MYIGFIFVRFCLASGFEGSDAGGGRRQWSMEFDEDDLWNGIYITSSHAYAISTGKSDEDRFKDRLRK